MSDTKKHYLQIATLGNPVLRKKAKIVADLNNPQVNRLIDDLIATAVDNDGVGIAAPQVYESLQIFIITSKPNKRYPNAPYMKPTPIINPEIIAVSKSNSLGWEGCLSVPGIRGIVSRFDAIKVEYLTREGKKIRREFQDFIARIFQHEYDHLNGLLFLDRVSSSADLYSEKEYNKKIAKISKRTS